MDTKAQMMWKVSIEQEQKFRAKLDCDIYQGFNLEELFKLIRGTEYRRGKEDGRKEVEKEK